MTIKKMVLSLLIILMVLSLVFAGCSSTEPSGETKSVHLSMATYNPEEAGQSQVLIKFAEDVERLTNGRVTFDFYPGGMLVSAGDMYDGVVEGITDIGYSNLAYSVGRFPETELLDTPIGFPNAWVANHVATDYFKEYQPKEFDDVHMLVLHTSAVNNIITIDKTIKKPEDLRGLSLRGTGYIGELVEAMGASAQALPMPDAYDYLSRHVIDGLMIPYETMKTYNYAEVVKHVTEVWPLGQVYTFYLAMNKDSWNSLSAEDQKIITKYIEEEFDEMFASMWNGIEVEGKRYAIEEGFEIYEIPAAELPLWRERADNVMQTYTKRMVDRGYSEAEINNRIDFVHERIEKWTEKQIELGIKSATGPPEVLENY